MGNPQISFRLTTYQLARGLKIIRTIEPEHVPTSLSQLVKTLYIDYLAKTSLKKTDVVSEADIAEIYNIINTKSKTMSFSDFQVATSTPEESLATKHVMEPESETSGDMFVKPAPKPEPTAEEIVNDESEITSLSDFSPPEDWNA